MLLNRSYLDPAEVSILVRFVLDQCPASCERATILVTDDDEVTNGIVGSAFEDLGDGEHRVELAVGAPLAYPVCMSYRTRSGPAYFRNWREHFVHALAHELRHIEQYGMAKPPYHYEVDAERFAHGVVAVYTA